MEEKHLIGLEHLSEQLDGPWLLGKADSADWFLLHEDTSADFLPGKLDCINLPFAAPCNLAVIWYSLLTATMPAQQLPPDLVRCKLLSDQSLNLSRGNIKCTIAHKCVGLLGAICSNPTGQQKKTVYRVSQISSRWIYKQIACAKCKFLSSFLPWMLCFIYKPGKQH